MIFFFFFLSDLRFKFKFKTYKMIHLKFKTKCEIKMQKINMILSWASRFIYFCAVGQNLITFSLYLIISLTEGCGQIIKFEIYISIWWHWYKLFYDCKLRLFVII